MLLGNVQAADNRISRPYSPAESFTLTGRVQIPESGSGPYDSVSLAFTNGGVHYWGTLLYGASLVERNSIEIMRSDGHRTLVPMELTPGWYTVRLAAEQGARTLRLKVWRDGTDEPTAWQTSEPLVEGWKPTAIGFRHFGTGTYVDDLVVVPWYDATSAPIPGGVAVTSSALNNWPTVRLVDGSGSSTWSSNGHGEHLTSSEWAVVLLPSRTTVSSVRITPRRDPLNPTSSLGFPKDFVIQYSYDGDGFTCDAESPAFRYASNWRPLITRFGFPQPSNEAVTFTFSPVEAQCMRILGTELSQDDYGNRYLQLSEVELYNDSTKLTPILAVTSSALNNWPTVRLVDGSGSSTWSSNGHGEHLTSSEWAVVLLPSRTTVSSVRITPRRDPLNPTSSLGFPKDFVIQYSYDGDGFTCDAESPAFRYASNWRPLITRFGFPQPSNEAVTFTFSPVEAQCMRILGTELSQDDYGNRYLQLSEVELYNDSTKLTPILAVTSSALNNWPTVRLVDGSGSSTWSSNGHGEHLTSSEWAVVLLPSRTTVSSVRITPRRDPLNPTSSLGFPKDFVIQYSYDGDGFTCDAESPAFRYASNWRPLITRFGFPQPSNEAVTFTFSPVEAQCMRILGTELSQDDYGNRYLQLSEVELR